MRKMATCVWHTYLHTYHSRSIPKGEQRHLKYSSETPTFYQNYLAIRNTADVTGALDKHYLIQSNIWKNSIAPWSVHFGVRSRKLSNIGRSLDAWPKIYYLELLRASEGTISCGPGCILQSLAPTNTHWAHVVSYSPSPYVLSIKKACAPAVRTIIGWWWYIDNSCFIMRKTISLHALVIFATQMRETRACAFKMTSNVDVRNAV
jgi:hypothetical protein